MSQPVSEKDAEAFAVLALEWFKASRRLSRLTKEVAPARYERERAQLAYSQIRVEDTLAKSGMRLITHDGLPFSPEIPAEPVNPEDFETDEGLVVLDTLEPTIIFNGRVFARGLVVLAKDK